MGQAKTTKLYRTFVKGLITEASYLTYPEDSSFDELNTVLSRKGNRTRRFGFNYNTGNAVTRAYDTKSSYSEYMWNSVASTSGLNFLCVQAGSTITFFDRSVTGFAGGLKAFSVDLTQYLRPGAAAGNLSTCKFSSGKGYLFVVNADIEPLVIRYDKTVDNIAVTKIVILGRDFEGLPDNLANDTEPTTLSRNHFYNLKNQGW